MTPAAQVEAEAGAWLARRDGDGWGPGDQDELDAWLAASTAHRIAFLRLETVWTKADRLRAVAPRTDAIEAAAGEEDGVGEPEPAMPGARSWRRYWYVPAAAAAAVLLALIPTWWTPDTQDPETEGIAYTTPVGGFQRLPLADGSRVDINTNSALDVAYSPGERRVSLNRGEAFFTVAHDRSRPFIVVAGDYRVTAVGTAFSVRRDGDRINVAVTEGRVRLERVRSGGSPEQLAFVSAGQRFDVLQTTAIVTPVAPQQLDQALSWRDGLLVFENQPLGDVAAEFNRYNSRQLVVDPSAARVSVSGTFRANNLDGFLRLLGQGFDVRPVNRGRDEVVLTRG